MGVYDATAVAYQLKRVYGNRITDLFNRQTMTYNLFEKSDRKAGLRPGGAGFYFAVRNMDNEGVGARAENGKLPTPLAGEGAQGNISPRLIYAVLRMSGLAVEAGKGDIAAFVDVQGDAVSNAYKSLVNDLNRQCWGDGTGLLATLSTGATTSTSATWNVTCNNDEGVRYCKPGMVVDFYESTTMDIHSNAARISSINPITKVLTMEALAGTYVADHPDATAALYTNTTSQAIASGAFVVRYGARALSHVVTTRYEIDGFDAMFDDGTVLTSFEGITIATDDIFKANLMGNSSVNREVSIDLMLAAMDMSYARCGETPSRIFFGLGQRRKYFALLANDVRYAPGQFVGGFERLAFAQNAQIPIIVDPMAKPNKIYFEAGQGIKKYELTPIGWGGLDEQKMHWREGYDQATMFLRTYTNLGVEQRNGLTVLKDLVEPSNQPW